jgi:NDP-sugar pyrophosphorylase family protein
MSEVVEAHFGNGQNLGMDIAYSCDPFPLGTGGALRYALSKTKSEHLLILNGDSYCRFDFPNFLKTHQIRCAKASLILVRAEDCSRYGTVKINKDGKVLAFSEKSSRRHEGFINTGIYLLDRKVVEEIQEGKMVSLEKEVFPKLIGKGLYGVLSEGPFIDIGTPESYLRAESILKDEFKDLS